MHVLCQLFGSTALSHQAPSGTACCGRGRTVRAEPHLHAAVHEHQKRHKHKEHDRTGEDTWRVDRPHCATGRGVVPDVPP